MEKMTVSGPSLGGLTEAMRLMALRLGYHWIEATPDQDEVYPGRVCYPMQEVASNIKAAADKGAAKFWLFSSAGPCCIGRMLPVIRKIAERNENKIEILWFGSGKNDPGIWLQKVDQAIGGRWGAFIRVVPRVVFFLFLWERTENAVWDAVAVSTHHGDAYAKRCAVKLWRECRQQLREQKQFVDAEALLRETGEKMQMFLKKSPPRGFVGIKGSLYSTEGHERSGRVRYALALQGLRSRRIVPLWQQFILGGKSEPGWIRRRRRWREIIRIYPLPCRPAEEKTERLDLDTLWAKRV